MLTASRISSGAPLRKPKEIDYPSSDGKPIAETDTHVDALFALKDLLRRFYGDRPDVYVAANNFIYYTEGNVKDRFSPDVYVVFGVPKGKRNSYFMFREKQPPAAVFEFTSRKTKHVDQGSKKELCARLGIKEYFMCDPQSKSLKPPLQGFRLTNGSYHPIAPGADGSVYSEQLKSVLRLENCVLVLSDPVTGKRFLSAGEAEEAYKKRTSEVERKLQDSESENARLRAEIERLKGGG